MNIKRALYVSVVFMGKNESSVLAVPEQTSVHQRNIRIGTDRVVQISNDRVFWVRNGMISGRGREIAPGDCCGSCGRFDRGEENDARTYVFGVCENVGIVLGTKVCPDFNPANYWLARVEQLLAQHR